MLHYRFTMDKSTLRLEFSAKRRKIPSDEKLKYDKEISENIINSDYFKRAENVLVFSSTPEEFDTRFIVERCRLLHKHLYYPRCIDNKGNMEFLKTDSADDLEKGMYSLSEPKAYCKKYNPKPCDIIIVPALSVDKNGHRIGYGKGYYDRFLRSFDGVSICPCYDELLTDTLPTHENDVKIKIIATRHFIKEVIL